MIWRVDGPGFPLMLIGVQESSAKRVWRAAALYIVPWYPCIDIQEGFVRNKPRACVLVRSLLSIPSIMTSASTASGAIRLTSLSGS